MKKIILFWTTFLFIIIKINLFAQDGELDLTFANNGIFNYNLGNVNNGDLFDICSLNDGNLIALGIKNNDLLLMKMNNSGELDQSFGENGIKLINTGNGQFQGRCEIFLLSNNIFLIGGALDNGSNKDIFLLFLDYNGNIIKELPEVTVDINNGSQDIFSNMIIIDDNNYIIGGTANSDIFLIKINKYGVLDSNFGENGKVIIDINNNSSDICAKITKDSDGNIYMTGKTGNLGKPFIVKTNAAGELENDFGNNGIIIIENDNFYFAYSNDIKVFNNYVYIGGRYDNGFFSEGFIMRYDLSGVLDSTYGFDGLATASFIVSTFDVQSDGKVVFGGNFWSSISDNGYQLSVSRLTTSGYIDNTFQELSYGGRGEESTSKIIIQPNGKILILGKTIFRGRIEDQVNLLIFRLNYEVLPVELVSLSITAKEEGALLSWRTIAEINNLGFEIQRKRKGANEWNTVGFVKGKGNSNNVNNYTFFDKLSSEGIYFYRLKQIDYDGKYKYTSVISLIYKKEIKAFLLEQNYPNPFNSFTKIKFEIPYKTELTLDIYDIRGQKIITLVKGTYEAGFYEINFNADFLSAGNYFYVLSTNEQKIVKKFTLLK